MIPLEHTYIRLQSDFFVNNVPMQITHQNGNYRAIFYGIFLCPP